MSATLRMKAAVLPAAGEPVVVEEVELADPGPGEVRVRIDASGVCHSDWNAATGASATPLPAVLGHEGSGVVEATGAAVTSVSPGDLVARQALRNGKAGGPGADEYLAAAAAPFNPYFQPA